MSHAYVIDALRAFEQDVTAALRSGDAEPVAADRYDDLRAQALVLNDRHQWLNREEAAAQLPTLEALAGIRRLDDGFGAPSGHLDLAHEGLARLAGWAAGLRMAYETLQDIDGACSNAC